MASLEDLERRVIALERATERDRSVERAVAEIVAESEKRLADRMAASELRMDAKFTALEKRLDDRVTGAERRMVDVLNERFDAVMTALDRPRS
jgi:hypothetical protein